MKKFLLSVFLFPLFSFIIKTYNNELIGTWKLNRIILNEDTIFYRSQLDYSLKHNFELNKNWISNYEDSLTVIKRAEEAFQNSMSIKVEFLTDSTFKMTKIRSGGRISLNEFDYGTFKLVNDTLLMTNKSRGDYKMMFLVDIENNRLYQRDGATNFMVYQEYLKID